MSIHSMGDSCYAPYIMAEQKLVPAVLAYKYRVTFPEILILARDREHVRFSERMRVVHVVVWQ